MNFSIYQACEVPEMGEVSEWLQERYDMRPRPPSATEGFESTRDSDNSSFMSKRH